VRRDEPSVPPGAQRPSGWASDAIADVLSGLGIRYIALTPGSSFRGFHDSLVNHLGNEDPTMLVCLHEEHAVAIAHGYAKVTEEPIAAALHANVGLMHATMAIYNAYCDRMPLLLLGATGPWDAAKRRPWIDWVHTASDQGALVRPYTKWDDQPASLEAALEALCRAHVLATTYPYGPTYICLDVELQEAPLSAPSPKIDLDRLPRPSPPEPSPANLAEATRLLRAARRPVLLIGRVGRSEEAWRQRIELAERLCAAVVTDAKVAAAFPSRHRLNSVAPGTFLGEDARRLLRRADVIVSLDWVDLAGTLAQAFGGDAVSASVVSCTMDHVLHNGWTKDHFGLPPVDLAVAAHPDRFVVALLERLASHAAQVEPGWPGPRVERQPAEAVAGGIEIASLAKALRHALADVPHCLVRLPLGWDGADLDITGPLDYLGQDGGAGIGSGPGIAVGAALALDGTGRLPVAVLGDGDLLMGAGALWTAAHHRLPLLVVVANNRSYFNDEQHQERIARQRGRPVANRWVGQYLRDPVPNLAALASSLGLVGYGPVCEQDRLDEVLVKAVEQVRSGHAVLVDVWVGTFG
jgi:thiamine pyrophosphate-dependent acetolactate synthase large subunit-like protein